MTKQLEKAIAAYEDAVALELAAQAISEVAQNAYNDASRKLHVAQQARLLRGADVLKLIHGDRVK